MIYEHRHYELMPKYMDLFYLRFDQYVLPSMRNNGITVMNMWKGVEHFDFFYILSWDNLLHRDHVWSAFMNDRSWTDKRDMDTEKYGPFVRTVHSTFMRNHTPLFTVG